MKIDDAFLPSGDLRPQHVSRTPETRIDGRTAERRPESPGTDSASLSSLGVELSRAIEQEAPDVVSRISRLQEAVSNGTYTVPSSQVAGRIVASSLRTEL